jgi:hypothetical protein
MARPLSYEEIAQVLNDVGIPHNPNTVQQNVRRRQEMCGCGKDYVVDSRGIVKFGGCGCSIGKAKLPPK